MRGSSVGDRKTKGDSGAANRFGTFGGVFTPSLLTILGVIMFLRFGVVVGRAGLWYALLVLAAAKAITLVTGLSISSIATNMRVKGGGAYYLISRSLGPEFGGVIAVFFYAAQAVAATLYVVGFVEALFSAFPGIGVSPRVAASLVNLAVFACVYVGAGWTIRVQYFILAVLLLSVLSFFAGAALCFSPDVLRANLAPAWTPDHSFFSVFALFFPAVTGIMAGVNMSGDLRDPGRSIPRGTLYAIGAAALVYAGFAFFLAAAVPRSELLGGGFVVMDHSLWSPLVYAGVFCATLSSALGSMMGAPRILQAFARDGIFPRLKPFARGSGSAGEPRRAIALTFLVAQAGIFSGGLDVVAPVITMFFLMTYGSVNLACFFESLSRNPSFRPTFRFNHWSVALAGALGCLAVMFLVNPVWAAAAILLAASLYFLVARAEILVKWGDLDSGLAYQRARNALLRLELERYHPKNWRPSVLALSGGPYNRLHLAEYASWLTAGCGVVSIAQIIRGDLDDLADRRREAESILRKFIRDEDLDAFPVVAVDESVPAAVRGLLQCHGIGGLRPNLLLLGWSRDPGNARAFASILSLAKKLRRSIVLVAGKQKDAEGRTLVPEGAINVWWTAENSGALMLLLAHQLSKNPEWRSRPVRILRTVPPRADVDNVSRQLRDVLALARIEAEVVVLPADAPLEAVRGAMLPSAVLFAGFDPPGDGNDVLLPFLGQVADLPGDVLLVYNSGDASLQA